MKLKRSFNACQGCQIFLGTIYQNRKKYTKLPQNKPNVHKNIPNVNKINQMSIKIYQMSLK
jgi:hypothetical protein